MRILAAGSSGFRGRKLVDRLRADGQAQLRTPAGVLELACAGV
jgi:hypothetical protein